MRELSALDVLCDLGLDILGPIIDRLSLRIKLHRRPTTRLRDRPHDRQSLEHLVDKDEIFALASVGHVLPQNHVKEFAELRHFAI